MLIVPIGYFFRIESETIDDMIAEQYGIRCGRDGKYTTLPNFNNGEPMKKDLGGNVEDEKHEFQNKGEKKAEGETEMAVAEAKAPAINAEEPEHKDE